jgi:hypothetical protein
VKEIAQIGAAIGRKFSYELIATVAPMPQVQLGYALMQLSASGLAFRRGRLANDPLRQCLVVDDIPEHFLCCVAFTVTASVSTNVHWKSVLIPRGRSFICWIRMFR